MEAAARTAAGSPPWILLTSVLASELTGLFGHIGLPRVLVCVALGITMVLVIRLVLRNLEKVRTGGQNHASLGEALTRAFFLDIFMSSVWGLVVWLLWEPGNLANHVFLTLVLLSVGVRLLVSRAASMEFFVASFGPMAILLFLRLLTEWSAPDAVLAAIIPIYAGSLMFDARRHTKKSFTEAQLRFGMADMAQELERARDEALRGRAQAEDASKSKTAFLANMSHELRTPLNAILGFSEIISQECLGPVGSPRYREYAGDIHSSGTHLLSLINDLLDVAKIESGRMEIAPNLLRTRHCLETALKFVSVRARERKQILTIDVEAEAELLYADERALRQIVINLVSNAVKFTAEGGTVGVRAESNANGEFVLSVRDNGTGIAEEKIEAVFEPFSQINNQFDRTSAGTGLGLALVRGLVELHGGRAWLESKEGEGATAYVVFPNAPELPLKRAVG
jgi:two-component system cell cycle sensor histidine kinase PleC